MVKDYKHDAACHIDGCHKDIFGAGLCTTHYQRKRRHGHTDDPPVITGHPCSVSGCHQKTVTKNLCRLHYRRQLKHGDPTVTLLESVKGKTCTIDRCEQAVRAKNLCTNHYANYTYMRSRGALADTHAYIRLRNGGTTR